MRKAVGQVSLVEALLPMALGSNQWLERTMSQIDWAPVETLLQPMRRAPTGCPAYPPLVQLKALLLQQWYRLSDRDLEEALAGRLSFPALLRAWAGGCSTGCDDLVALPDRSGRGRPGRSGARRLERPARAAWPVHQGRHDDRCHAGGSRREAAAPGLPQPGSTAMGNRRAIR